MLQRGDQAPTTIALRDENGESFTLHDLRGWWVVVYFYPKDLTPGCTLEAEEFRDAQTDFQKLHARVLGVSKDSCVSHQKFKNKMQLTFTLVADETHELMEAFGVWGQRKFMGRTYMGTSRSTFLVSPTGELVHVWENIKPLGHAKEVLDVLKHVAQN